MSAPAALSSEDHRLVELVDSVLVDPNVHTDLRLRLHHEIADLVTRTGREARARAGTPEASETGAPPPVPGPAPASPGAAELLRAVLVDPDLHSDLRLRLHREIPSLIAAHHPAAVAARER